MTHTAFALALGAAAALAGCNSKDHTIVAGPDTGQETNVGANADVQLPPPIAASKIYRCSGDNSVVYVDWLADDKTANVRTEQNGSPTQVTTAEAGKPLTGANGLILTGTPSGASISVKLPKGATKTWRA
jgi:hypothetical protein